MTEDIYSILQQIANRFATYASDQRASLRWQGSKRQKADCSLRGEVWEEAAEELRDIAAKNFPQQPVTP